MTKSTKIVLSILGGILVLAIILILLNNFAENKITRVLEEEMTKANLTFEEIDVNLLSRKAGITEPAFDFEGKKLKARQLTLDDIEIFSFLIDNEEIVIGEILLENPEFQIVKDEGKKKEGEKETGKDENELKKKILVKSLNIQEGSFTLTETDSAKNTVFSRFKELQFKNLKVNSTTVKDPIPFFYESYAFKGDSLFFNMDPRHDLVVGGMEINNGKSVIRDIRILPLYGKQEFQQHIPYELDRFDLEVEEVRFSDLKWEIKNDSLHLTNPLLSIDNAILEVYRDKLQSDDTRQKKMYSHMVRNLPVKIKLDTIRLNNTYILYEEKIDEDRSPGEVDFKNLNASIYNLSNVNMDSDDFKPTDIDVETLFMQEANLTVNWNFDISNPNDLFRISGNMDRLSEEAMNRFLKPALNVEAQGGIEDMKFDYRGNHTRAEGSMKFVYHDFKVEVLRSDGERKNKFFSAIANLFIKNDAQEGEQEEKGLEVTRDKTKSFWNYLWLSIREGALKAFL